MLPSKTVEALLAHERDKRSRALMNRVFVSRRGPNGRLLSRISMAVVNVQRGRDAENELIKDAALDETGALVYVDPDVFAKLYAALEGRRTIQTSARFWLPGPDKAATCQECGTVHCDGRRPCFHIVDSSPGVEAASSRRSAKTT
jgi:hypothetical protein